MIKFNKITDINKLPEKNPLGFDVFSSEDVTINPGETKTIKLGFSIESKMDKTLGYYFGLYLRESLGRRGLILVNGVGVLSLSQPEREVTISLFNPLNDPCSYENRIVKIKQSENIAQIILHRALRINLV